MSTSREKMIQQIERCVQHQKVDILPGPEITGPPEQFHYCPVLEPEPMGNGSEVQCDTSSVWGLRPPGEETPMSDVNVGDWA